MQFLDDILVRAFSPVHGQIGGCDRTRELDDLLAEDGRRNFVRGRVWTVDSEFQLILGESFHVVGQLSVLHDRTLAKACESRPESCPRNGE